MDLKQFDDGMLTLLEMSSLGVYGEIILLHHHNTAFFVTVALFL